jgi:hypothetical protein
MPNIDRQLRRRAGIPRNTRKAKTAPPAPIHPLSEGLTWSIAAVDVVAMVSVAVPLAVPFVTVTVEPAVQVGGSLALAGPEVAVQVSVMTPL